MNSISRNRSSRFSTLVLAGVLCLLPRGNPAEAQVTRTVILDIDVENITSYSSDVFDVTKFATDPNLTTVQAGPRNFGFVMAVGDIVAVNGRPAKGTLVVRQQAVILNPTPIPGQGAADIVRTGVSDYLLEIQQADGSLVGGIHTLGMSGGTAPAGAPAGGGNLTVAGGTGAFLGARGQMATRLLPGAPPPRTASVTEDPARRRSFSGGRVQFSVQLLPLTQPEIVITQNGPAIFHADFTAVTPGSPARPGEVLIARASGLGPTRPGVTPGQPFPSDPLQEVNSPVEVSVGSRAADVVNKVGWPGSIGNYRIDFRVPEGTPPGLATIQVSAAWVSGPEAQIYVQ